MAGNTETMECDDSEQGPSTKKKKFCSESAGTIQCMAENNESERSNKKAKTAAERARDFRARKRLQREQTRNEEQESTNFLLRDENSVDSSKEDSPKSAAERTRRWRERNRNASILPKTRALTGAERTRKYRERKKQLLGGVTPTNNFDWQSDIHSMSDQNEIDEHVFTLEYDGYAQHKKAHEKFVIHFRRNPFGFACIVCDRLWFKKELKRASKKHEPILQKITNITNASEAAICLTCKVALDNKKIPVLSTYNGFTYPEMPPHLPQLDVINARLISPRLPFTQIRRLRHVNGKPGIHGQIINMPVSVNTKVKKLPRNIDDDNCINVHFKKKKSYGSGYLKDLVDERNLKVWLNFLITTPLYYHIAIDKKFSAGMETLKSAMDITYDISENIPVEESLTAQQHTLLWDEKNFSEFETTGDTVLESLFDEHAEELSFPTIYLGQPRAFRDEIKATPFTIASSELRRKDRRGITPYHLLYVALKIMRLRIRDCLKAAYRNIGPNMNVNKAQIESDGYIYNCVESSMTFLRSIPNSTWYWAQRKKDLFAIIRQKGRPTAYMSLSANEEGWTDLIQLLYKLANGGTEISKDAASKLISIEKSTLINEDAVTCAIYFNKLVNVLMTILQSKDYSPFGRYRVADYFKRIDFEHRGSFHAHILLWLDNAPDDMLGHGYEETINMINSLMSVSASQASGNINIQKHKHTFTCFKKKVASKQQKCKFEAPFMPCRATMIVTPMEITDPRFSEYSRKYTEIRNKLEILKYKDLDDFYRRNNISSDYEYRNILSAGVTRSKVFPKRDPSEKWHNTFNPFVLSLMKSNMEFQVITDEHSCAAYVGEYVNKSDRGMSDLRRRIVEIIDENPESNLVDISKKLSVDIVNNVEMSSQEAAWYLLREPMVKSSVSVEFINTVWPTERQKCKKTPKELGVVEDEASNAYKEDYFDKYEKRPEELEHVTLAQFVSKFYKNKEGVYAERKEGFKVIRYRNYDMIRDYNEFKREMVTLHIPFRDEEKDILSAMKYINIYNDNEDLISEKRKEFESNTDIRETIEICRQMCRDNNDESDDENEIREATPTEEFSDTDDSASSDSTSSNPTNTLFLSENWTDTNEQICISNDERAEDENAMDTIAIEYPLMKPVQTLHNSSDIDDSDIEKQPDTNNRDDSAITPTNTIFLAETWTDENPSIDVPNSLLTDEIEIHDELPEPKPFQELFNCKTILDPKNSTNDSADMLLWMDGTWMDENIETDIFDFHCIAKFQRQNAKASNVSICQKQDTKSNIITSNMNILMRNPKYLDVGQSSVGDICTAHCILEDGIEMITTIVFITPDSSVQNIIQFLYEKLFVYGTTGSKQLEVNYNKLPLLLAGNFNIDFDSIIAEPLVKFLHDKLEMKMNTDPAKIIINRDKGLDVVFSRYLDKLCSKPCISYSRCDKLTISFLDSKLSIPKIYNEKDKAK